MEFFINNVFIILLLPLWVILTIILNTAFSVFASKKITLLLTLLSTFISFIFSVFLLCFSNQNIGNFIEENFVWLNFGDYNFYFGYFIDNLSAIMLVILTSVSFFVQLYSYGYMKNERLFQRFFVYLNLFNFAMIGLIISSNLIQTYIFWELVGVCSYLLIGFYSEKKSASDASQKAFLINRAGDCGLLIGIISLLYFSIFYQPLQSYTGLTFSSIKYLSENIFAITTEPVFYIICLCLLFGSIAKSAQFPLHVWLSDAMEAPTPVSALIHAATMVAAGVFLILRLLPFYQISELAMQTILWVGLITAFLTALIACAQNDFKKMLAFSTCSQLGLMFVAIGVTNPSGAFFHLTTHAYFKALLFLCAGCVLFAIHHIPSMEFMGGLRKKLPITAFCYLIGAISLSGLCFSGFYSKELILTSVFEFSYLIPFIICIFISFLSSFYIFRSYFLVFEGTQKYEFIDKKPLKTMQIAILILAFLTIFLGFFIKNYFNQTNDFNFIVFIITTTIVILGFISVLYLHKKSKLNQFLPDFLFKPLKSKLYFDEIYLWSIKRIYEPICSICSFIDKFIINGFVNSVGFISRVISIINSKLQTGNIQSYMLYSCYGLAFVLIISIFMYYTLVKG